MKPTKTEEKKWLDRVTEYAQTHGAFPDGETYAFDRHHVVGREGKNNKVHIGRWFLIPVSREFHDIHSNSPLNVTHFRKRYTAEFGNQRDQFAAMCAVIKDEDGELPFDMDVYHAIMNTRY